LEERIASVVQPNENVSEEADLGWVCSSDPLAYSLLCKCSGGVSISTL
jgi:hypothetical protein